MYLVIPHIVLLCIDKAPYKAHYASKMYLYIYIYTDIILIMIMQKSCATSWTVHVPNKIRDNPFQGILSFLRVDDPQIWTFTDKVQDFIRDP